MRFISLRALLALVVLPPILYVTAIQGLERYLEHRYRSEILKQIPGNTQALLAGRERLSDHIEAVVDKFMADTALRHYGAVLSISIRTQGGRRLYPPVFSESALAEPIHDAMDVASENFALLHEGLDVSLEVVIDQNTLVANGVLVLSLGVALGCLTLLYNRGKRDFDREEAQRQREQATIKKREETQKLLLSSLEGQRATLAAEIETIQTKLASAQERAARNEADLFDEVELLERKLQYNLSQQDRQQDRIRELEEQLARLAKERQALSAQQNRDLEGLRKRMETLYKNTAFSDRALSGMKELTEPMQIKAEEIIHQLDAQTDQVPVKRKLFRGKGKETVFEIVFAYKGRLYFRRTKDRKVDILVIGTKNSQEKDLVYLDRL
jgi:hypothetical protein